MALAQKVLLFYVLVATILWSLLMGFESRSWGSPAFRKPAACSGFSQAPILDVELASSADCFQAILEQGNPANLAKNAKILRINTYMDFLFIALYWSSFVLFALVELTTSRGRQWSIALISGAALFDLLENWRILSSVSDLTSPGRAVGLLAAPFSTVKWALLGLVLCLLGFFVWSKLLRDRALTVALFASGVLTLGGLIFRRALGWGVYGFALVVVLLVIRFWPSSLGLILEWIEFAYLIRFQIFAALVLAVGLPVAYWAVPSVFEGIFDGRGVWSFTFIVWAAFQLAWTIMVTCRLVMVYGPVRFARLRAEDAEQQPAVRPTPVRLRLVSAFAVLALPLVIVLFIGTGELGAVRKGLATVLGVALAVFVLFLTAWLHFAIEEPGGTSAELVFPTFGFLAKKPGPRSSFWRFIGSVLESLPPDLTVGIVERGRLRSGHEMAAIAMAVFLALYVAVGARYQPGWASPDSQPAALFFVLLLLTVFTWALAGAAFFLDRTRLPVFATLLVVSLLGGFLRTDHEFSIYRNDKGAVRTLRPEKVVNKWKEGPRKNGNVATIVATAGGGIRAAAWTAEVMTRLEEQCQGKLSRSLVLMSSVSGGSVGTMFVLEPFDQRTGAYPKAPEALESIRSNARRSSLSSVGWGFAYPDLARTLPLFGSAVPQTLDRGWALENAWVTTWKKQAENYEPRTLAGWQEAVEAGTRPAVIFNATISESGERFLIGSTEMDSRGGRQFFGLFPAADLHVETAARLSATFPYVSPMARPSEGSLRKRYPIAITDAYHIGDGGYYDNSGLLSAVEWLEQTGESLKDSRILLILIDSKPGQEKTGSSWSWQKQLVGPIETLLHVRTSSQQVRESIELDMAVKYLASEQINVIPVSFLFSSERVAPLSWHLTARDIEEIHASWLKKENVSAAAWACQMLNSTGGSSPAATGR